MPRARADALEHTPLQIAVRNPVILMLFSLLATGIALGCWLS